MTRILLVLGILAISMNVSAQFISAWETDFFTNARLRDRNMKFSSPRLEAMQMRAAIEDETNALDLDRWGDNRAWLGVENSNQIKIGAALDNHKYLGLGPKEPGSIRGVGIYSRIENGFELEATDQTQKESYALYSKYTSTQKDSGMGIGWGRAFGNFLAGLHWNNNYASIKYSDETDARKARYQFAGAAMAVKLGVAALGATVDSVDISGLRGTKYGAQATIASNGFKIGLRAARMPLKKRFGYLYYYGSDESLLKGFTRELGARVLWTVPGLPLDLGAECSNYYEKFETESNGQTYHGGSSNIISGSYSGYYYYGGSRATSNTMTVGAALKLFKNRMLIGLEHKYVLPFSHTKIRYNTIGLELRPVERLALRSSYQYGKTTWRGNPDDKAHTGAVGLGYNFSKILSVDITGRRVKYIYVNSVYTRFIGYDGHLAMSARF